MRHALAQAHKSLREGNNGFGAVVARRGKIIAAAHDGQAGGCAAHAEMNALRQAGAALGEGLAGCVLVSTRQPCPACMAAAAQAGIGTIAYGCAAGNAAQSGARAATPNVRAGVLAHECALLYRDDVRQDIQNLRNADDAALAVLREDSVNRRLTWYRQNKAALGLPGGDLLDAGYRLLLARLRITAQQAPVVNKTDTMIVFHSQNFCPTLEACKILGLDTRHICRHLNEASMDALVKQLDGRLTFSRNYRRLRPHAAYCEEMITLGPG